jgi:Erv1 / Alr family
MCVAAVSVGVLVGMLLFYFGVLDADTEASENNDNNYFGSGDSNSGPSNGWIGSLLGVAAGENEAQQKLDEYLQATNEVAVNRRLGRMTWELLHRAAAGYPLTPSAEDSRRFWALVDSLLALYPCSECRANLKVALMSPQLGEVHWNLESRENAVLFVCRLHNVVNSLLGKREHSCAPATLDALYSSAEDLSWFGDWEESYVGANVWGTVVDALHGPCHAPIGHGLYALGTDDLGSRKLLFGSADGELPNLNVEPSDGDDDGEQQQRPLVGNAGALPPTLSIHHRTFGRHAETLLVFVSTDCTGCWQLIEQLNEAYDELSKSINVVALFEWGNSGSIVTDRTKAMRELTKRNNRLPTLYESHAGQGSWFHFFTHNFKKLDSVPAIVRLEHCHVREVYPSDRMRSAIHFLERRHRFPSHFNKV